MNLPNLSSPVTRDVVARPLAGAGVEPSIRIDEVFRGIQMGLELANSIAGPALGIATTLAPLALL